MRASPTSVLVTGAAGCVKEPTKRQDASKKDDIDSQ